MPQTLVLVHTVPPLVTEFTRLASEVLPGVRLLHILDEPLLERIRQRGAAAEDEARLLAHVAEAAAICAHAVLVTCSTVSPLVARVQPAATIPVFPIDQAMVAEAVRLGERIAVVATAATTLEPTCRLLERQAANTGRILLLESVLVEGALAHLLAGDGDSHDRLVVRTVLDLAPRCDVVVLAQATMARVLSALPSALPVPVLASPLPALRQVAAALHGAPHLAGVTP